MYAEIISWPDGSDAPGGRKPRALEKASTVEDSELVFQAMGDGTHDLTGEPASELGEKPEVMMNEDGSITVG